jgi:hypothetical protein
MLMRQRGGKRWVSPVQASSRDAVVYLHVSSHSSVEYVPVNIVDGIILLRITH